MSTHETYYWTAGDDWEINAQLVDSDGNPFDLTFGAPIIKWSLVSEAGERVLTEVDCEVVVTDGPVGDVSVRVPGAKTSSLAEGRYNDQIRIVYDDKTSTLSHGWNWVTNDAWVGAPVAVKKAAQ